MATLEKLREVILKIKKENITADKLTPEARFTQDLSFDSMDKTELVVLLEEAFGVVLDLHDLEDLSNIATMVEFLDQGVAQ